MSYIELLKGTDSSLDTFLNKDFVKITRKAEKEYVRWLFRARALNYACFTRHEGNGHRWPCQVPFSTLNGSLAYEDTDGADMQTGTHLEGWQNVLSVWLEVLV